MRLSLDEYKQRFPDRSDPAPLTYAGQWVAWNQNRTRILSHGFEFREVRAQAQAAGCDAPLLQKILGIPFVGGA